MTIVSSSILYFYPCDIYLEPSDHPTTSSDHSGWGSMSYVSTVILWRVIQTRKTGNILLVRIGNGCIVHRKCKNLKPKMYQFVTASLIDMTAPYISTPPPRLGLGATVLVWWLLFYSRPRTVLIFDDLILFSYTSWAFLVLCVWSISFQQVTQ